MTLTELALLAQRTYAKRAGTFLTWDDLRPHQHAAWEDVAKAIWSIFIQESLKPPELAPAETAQWAYEFWYSSQNYVGNLPWNKLTLEEQQVWQNIANRLKSS